MLQGMSVPEFKARTETLTKNPIHSFLLLPHTAHNKTQPLFTPVSDSGAPSIRDRYRYGYRYRYLSFVAFFVSLFLTNRVDIL